MCMSKWEKKKHPAPLSLDHLLRLGIPYIPVTWVNGILEHTIKGRGRVEVTYHYNVNNSVIPKPPTNNPSTDRTIVFGLSSRKNRDKKGPPLPESLWFIERFQCVVHSPFRSKLESNTEKVIGSDCPTNKDESITEPETKNSSVSFFLCLVLTLHPFLPRRPPVHTSPRSIVVSLHFQDPSPPVNTDYSRSVHLLLLPTLLG